MRFGFRNRTKCTTRFCASSIAGPFAGTKNTRASVLCGAGSRRYGCLLSARMTSAMSRADLVLVQTISVTTSRLLPSDIQLAAITAGAQSDNRTRQPHNMQKRRIFSSLIRFSGAKIPY